MKAPEKIYLIRNFPNSTSLNTTNDYHGKYLQEWYKSREKDADVEYTRTDAFIEKACEYINKLIDIPHNIECADNGEPLANSYIDYAKERLEVVNKIIEDFKNYMEGE